MHWKIYHYINVFVLQDTCVLTNFLERNVASMPWSVKSFSSTSISHN